MSGCPPDVRRVSAGCLLDVCWVSGGCPLDASIHFDNKDNIISAGKKIIKLMWVFCMMTTILLTEGYVCAMKY